MWLQLIWCNHYADSNGSHQKDIAPMVVKLALNTGIE